VFNFKDGSPPEIRFYALPTVTLNPNAQTIMRFSGNRPALAIMNHGRGKVLTLTGPISPEYSDLVGHAFFVPFVSRIAEYLASDLSSYDLHLYSGEQLTRAVTLAGAITYPLLMEAPDGSVYSVAPEEQQGALIVRPHPTDIPGIYSLRYLDREIDRFAMNINPSENDLASLVVDQLAVSLGVDNLNEIEVGQPLAPVVAGFRFGRELWQLFLWIAVGLFILEMLLSRGTPAEEKLG
jgi:hypothetical protein